MLKFLTRHPDVSSLSPSERGFIDRCRSRRTNLHLDSTPHDVLRQLARSYQWADFVRKFASSIHRNVGSIFICPIKARQQLVTSTISPSDRKFQTIQDTLTIISSQPPARITPPASIVSIRQDSLSAPKVSGARTATFSSCAPRTRRPWIKYEEDTLLAGVARVNSHHWSRVLALYGSGGSVSEVFKNRNKVQLKGKARNLKLRYSKPAGEVPECLRGVTGELRKRGCTRVRAALAAEWEAASS
jgi:hypothetical protein